MISDIPHPTSNPPRLTRRAFIGAGAAGSLALTRLGSSSGATIEGAPSNTPSGALRGGTIPGFELDERSITELQADMAQGRLTAAEITRLYLHRIDQIDRHGPELRTVIETNPDALELAASLDRERAAGRVRGPLHGIPVLVKDNIATADRMNTTAGSLALEGARPDVDSFVARRLREAGAVILGKANLTEWANFRSFFPSSGWSGRGGQCRNPYALERNPSGSSSGSAAAVTASLCAAAIGTETSGSIVSPSSACGVVGIKPTVGLVSRARIIPIADAFDTAGPIGRTVRDAAILLGALTGVDADDPKTAASAGNAHTDYTQFLDPNGLRGARIGVPRSYFGYVSAIDALTEAAIEEMARQGAEIIDPLTIPNANRLGGSVYDVMLYEFKAGINAYLAGLGSGTQVHSLTDLIAFNEAHANEEMLYFGQEVFLEAEAKGPLTDPAYLDALETCQRLSRAEGLDAVIEEYQLDALVATTAPPAWMIDLVLGDCIYGAFSAGPPAAAGYPHVTVPMGSVHGLPAGLSFFGPAWSEPILLRLAYAFEQTTMQRRPPRFLATAAPPTPYQAPGGCALLPFATKAERAGGARQSVTTGQPRWLGEPIDRFAPGR